VQQRKAKRSLVPVLPIHLRRQPDLLEVRHARRAPRLPAHASKDRQQNRGEDRHNRQHDEQLN
jgi:hypothetical protein